MATSRNIVVAADAEALATAAAERLIARVRANDRRIAICLTGGSSPQRLYRLLATGVWSRQIPWDQVHWFIGDDRFVPRTDPLNNMNMARQAFLDLLAPESNIHAMPTEADSPADAARLYEAELKSFYGAEKLDGGRPLFDMVLMGVGPDGHTASLFPGYPELEETERWAVGVDKANVAPFVPRVSLTLPVLGSCHEMLFEVSGAKKREILSRVLAGENLPAARAHAQGETTWLVDRAALPEHMRG